MRDKYNREIKYLRVSLTELCNLRCRYCMPYDGVCKKKHEEMMTEEETISAIRVAAKLGITKIRLTGGEPLLKKNIVNIVSNIKKIDGIEEVCMTTNAVLLDKYANDLKNAGLDRINISLDTLKEDKFKYITRLGNLQDTLNGLDKALEVGFKKIKINTVLIGGFNDDEIVDFAKITIDKPIDVRFIELMPMYDSGDFGEKAFMPYDKALERIITYFGNDNIEKSENAKGSVAKLYKIKDAKGHLGFISPVNNHFCAECNRIRLTADGKLKPCLHSSQEIVIKGLSEDEMEKKIVEAIYAKPEKHDELSYVSRSKSNRNMNEIGG